MYITVKHFDVLIILSGPILLSLWNSVDMEYLNAIWCLTNNKLYLSNDLKMKRKVNEKPRLCPNSV